MVQALLYWPHLWCGCDNSKPLTRRQETVQCPQFLTVRRHSCPDDKGPPLVGAQTILLLCTALKLQGVIEPSLVRLYFARLAGFLPAVLPGTIDDAELVAGGLGLTALGFLASR